MRTEADENWVVLFFYPGDREGLRYPELKGCTPEACAFRDALHNFQEAGARVFGVSLQSTDRQREFVDREGLTFELLSDARRELVEAWGVPLWVSEAGEEFVVRTTMVVAPGGRVVHVFEDVEVEGHVDAVLEAISADA